MKLKIYSIKDTVQGEHLTPFMMLRNDEEAKRNFITAINSEHTEAHIVKFYKDMELYRLGEFDTITGEITAKIEFLTNGVNVKEIKENEIQELNKPE